MAAVWVNRGGSLFWVDEDSEEHKRLLSEGGFETVEGLGVPFGAQASAGTPAPVEQQPSAPPVPESTEQPEPAPASAPDPEMAPDAAPDPVDEQAPVLGE